MHYDPTAFGKNGAIVMKKKENIQKSIADGEMGNRRVTSEIDKTKLRKAYHCSGEENFLVLTDFLVIFFVCYEFVVI